MDVTTTFSAFNKSEIFLVQRETTVSSPEDDDANNRDVRLIGTTGAKDAIRGDAILAHLITLIDIAVENMMKMNARYMNRAKTNE